MKFSHEWLQTWVKPGLTNEALAHQITMAGLEVDGIDAVAGDFSGIVVGHVVECGPHPDADKLQVTKIDIGSEELIDIVCGATNCRAGLKVAVATVGAVLPGDFKIKKPNYVVNHHTVCFVLNLKWVWLNQQTVSLSYRLMRFLVLVFVNILVLMMLLSKLTLHLTVQIA